MQYDYNNPETWRLQCSTCEEYILYEKLHRYHNAKSSMKRGNLRCCDKCKEANRKASLNPEDWHIPCSTCNEPIKYDNLASFRTVYGGYLKGHNRECEQCVTTTRKNIVRKDRQYSRDPKDWVVDCGNSECNRKITYNNLKSYQGSMKRRKDGNPPLCFSCVSKKCDRTTEEWKDKMGEVRERLWADVNHIYKFSPSHNKHTIPYIVSVLNIRFDTNFRHAESEKGEYRVYDKELKCYYFADAYCPKLNLWIEFDEQYKFNDGILKNEHIIRQNRIYHLLGCQIIRIKYHKTTKKETFQWYYDDTQYWGNLSKPIINFIKETTITNLKD